MADDTTQVIRIVVDASQAKAGSDQAREHLKAIEHQATTTGSAIDRISKSFEMMKGAGEAFLALAIVERFKSMVESAMQAATAIERMSRELGVTTDYLQSVQFAAMNAGVGASEFDSALIRLSRSIGLASEGGKKQIETFDGLGVKLLDVRGQLRPTADVMTDTARALQSMEDPAKRLAAEMALFGRGGAVVGAMLEDLAMGAEVMAIKARAAGTVLSEEVKEALHRLEIQSEISGKKWTTLVGTLAAPISTAALDKFNDVIDTLVVKINQAHGSLSRFLALSAGSALRGVGDVTQYVPIYGPAAGWVQKQAGNVWDYFSNNKGQLDPQARANQLRAELAAGGPAVEGREQQIQDEINALTPNFFASLAGPQSAGAATALYGVPKETVGVSNPLAKGSNKAAESLANALKMLEVNADIALRGAKAAAEAADQGADAVQRLEDHTKNVKSVTDAYQKSVKDGRDLTEAQRKEIELHVAALDKLTEATRVYNNIKTFDLQTVGINESNDVAQLQLAATGRTTEEIARMVDQQKAFNKERNDGFIAAAADLDLAKAAYDVVVATGDKRAIENAKKRVDVDEAARKSIDNRTKAIDQTAQLKAAQDDLNKSTQLWLAPFSQAIGSVTTTFEGFFETVLKGGRLTWQSMADTFKNIFVKMLAELAVLAVVRPVIMSVVQGVFSPGAAQSMGYGGSAGGSAAGLLSIFSGGGGVSPGIQGGGSAGTAAAASGNGGLSSLLGLGGLFGGQGTGMMGSFGQWLNTPFIGGEVVPAGMGAGLEGSAIAGTGLTPLGAIGGVGSIGMGIYSLLSGHGSTGSTVGGISGILGGGIGLASALIPAMAGLGPVGLGIGLVGGILGSLLGGGGPSIPPQPALDYGSGSFSFGANGGLLTDSNSTNAGNSPNQGFMAGTAGQAGMSVLGLIRQAGGSAVAGSLYGGYVGSGTNYTLSGGQWKGNPYTQAGYSAPDGTSTSIAYNSSQSFQQSLEQMIAAVFTQDVIHGGASGISATLKTALTNVMPTTAQGVQTDITQSRAYDDALKGGLNVTQAEKAIQQINDQFASLSAWAIQNGIDTAALDDAQTAAKQQLSSSFLKTQQTATLGATDPMRVQLMGLQDSYYKSMQEAQAIGAVNGNTDQLTAQATATFNTQISKVADDFIGGINAQLVALDNPMQAQIDALGKQRDANVTAAKAIDDIAVRTDAVTKATSLYGAQIAKLNTDFIKSMQDGLAAINDPFSSTITGIMNQRKTALQSAAALDGPGNGISIGPATTAANSYFNAQVGKLGTDFNYTISQGILSITDPLQAHINDLQKAKAAALKQGADINGAIDAIDSQLQDQYDSLSSTLSSATTGINTLLASTAPLTGAQTTQLAALQATASSATSALSNVTGQIAQVSAGYVDMAQVSKSYALQIQEAQKQFYDQELSGLDALIKNLQFGALSGGSPSTILSAAGAQYKIDLAGAQGGDATKLAALSGDASAYVQAAQTYYASGPGFYQIVQSVLAATQALDLNIRNGSTVDTNGNPVADTSGALSATVAAQNEQINALIAKVNDLTDKLDGTNSLLNRVVVNAA